jgi:F0F1-type ATP synthase gamma subunit
LRPILNTVTSLFADGTVDAVDVINTKYISTVSQEVQVRRLLPAGIDKDPEFGGTYLPNYNGGYGGAVGRSIVALYGHAFA